MYNAQIPRGLFGKTLIGPHRKISQTKQKKNFQKFSKFSKNWKKVQKWPFFAVFLPVFSGFFFNAPAFKVQSSNKKNHFQQIETSICILSFSSVGACAAENYRFFIFVIFVIFRKFSKNAKKAYFGHFCTFLQKIQKFIFLPI